MSILSTVSLSTSHLDFVDRSGAPIGIGEYRLLQGLAELAGSTADLSEAGPLPAPPALVPVVPAVGAVGLIALPTFTSGTSVPLTEATTAPDYHGARALILTAASGNADAIYFSQFPNTIPIGGVFGAVAYPVAAFSGSPLWANWTELNPDGYWTVGSGALTFSAQDVVLAASSVFEMAAFDLPAGDYELIMTFGAFSATGGTLSVTVYEGATLLDTHSTNGVKTMPFTWAGGSFYLILQADTTDAGDYSVPISSMVLNRVDDPGRVGTPLPAGESIILLARDMDLTRGIYVVPTIGEAADKVIANFQY